MSKEIIIPEVILKYYGDNIKKFVTVKEKIIIKRKDGGKDTWSKDRGGWLKDKTSHRRLMGGIGGEMK